MSMPEVKDMSDYVILERNHAKESQTTCMMFKCTNEADGTADRDHCQGTKPPFL